MTQSQFYSVFLIDACTVRTLDNVHRFPPAIPPFSPQEQGLIWDGLTGLAKAGRLKVIRQVHLELVSGYPLGAAKLSALHSTGLPIRRNRGTVLEYQRIVGTYPDIAPRPGKDNADPWLVLVAKQRNYCILSEELAINERSSFSSGKRKTQLRIPDVCEQEQVTCTKLRKLAMEEGWIA